MTQKKIDYVTTIKIKAIINNGPAPRVINMHIQGWKVHQHQDLQVQKLQGWSTRHHKINQQTPRHNKPIPTIFKVGQP